ncbi:MAG: hypothetical protein AAF363_19730 [Bacteroidota bacterium]
MKLEIVELVLGLVFVYLLFSTLVTLLVEYISSIFSLRAKNLTKIIQRALNDDEKSDCSIEFYNHPLIKYLSKKKGEKPSYISSNKFAKTVLDLIRTGGKNELLGKVSELDSKDISEAIDGLDILGDDTKTLLKSYAKEADENINEFGIKLENWFNETVERGQGWFNRQMKLITLIVSLVVAISLNVDSIKIYKELSDNPELRAEIAGNALEYVKDSSTRKEFEGDELAQYDSAKKHLITFYANELNDKASINALSIGWSDLSKDFNGGCSIIGWIITALAISLGAPFWFGVLNKVVALRGAASNSDRKISGKQVLTQNDDKKT